MTGSPSAPAGAASGQPAGPRRLTRQARRAQLVTAAMPLVARHGPMDLSLDDVAERVGVTRNLLYHYFPGGRADLVAGVVEEAERQLLGPPGTPNSGEALSRVLDHALAPTHAWRIHRMARALPALSGMLEATGRALADGLGGRDGLGGCDGLGGLASGGSSPLANLALQGYLAYAEAILDGARAAGIPRADIRRVLEGTLQAVVAAT